MGPISADILAHNWRTHSESVVVATTSVDMRCLAGNDQEEGYS